MVGREGLPGLRPRPCGVSGAYATLLSRPTASAPLEPSTIE